MTQCEETTLVGTHEIPAALAVHAYRAPRALDPHRGRACAKRASVAPRHCSRRQLVGRGGVLVRLVASRRSRSRLKSASGSSSTHDDPRVRRGSAAGEHIGRSTQQAAGAFSDRLARLEVRRACPASAPRAGTTAGGARRDVTCGREARELVRCGEVNDLCQHAARQLGAADGLQHCSSRSFVLSGRDQDPAAFAFRGCSRCISHTNQRH